MSQLSSESEPSFRDSFLCRQLVVHSMALFSSYAIKSIFRQSNKQTTLFRYFASIPQVDFTNKISFFRRYSFYRQIRLDQHSQIKSPKVKEMKANAVKRYKTDINLYICVVFYQLLSIIYFRGAKEIFHHFHLVDFAFVAGFL